VQAVELVRIQSTEFFVELAEASGPQSVQLSEVLSFDNIRETIQAIASELTEVWHKVSPSEASAEFGLSLTVKSGKLTGLLVQGDGNASLKLKLTWKSRADAAASSSRG
jgi:Trypsin-co-occurring domain 1